MTTASICTIGDEILIGQIVDTNSSYISRALNSLGIRVTSMLSIADDHDAIISKLENELRDNDIVIVTGGLGPTKDDITKKALGDLIGSNAVKTDERQLEIIHNILSSRGLDVLDINLAQAEVPQECDVIPNRLGTAPIMVFRFQEERFGHKATLYSLPGVPFEALGAMDDVLEDIRTHNSISDICHRTVMTFGIAESALAKMLEKWEDSLPEHMHLAYLPDQLTGVRLRLSIYDTTNESAESEIDYRMSALKEILGDILYSEEDDTEAIIDSQVEEGYYLTYHDYDENLIAVDEDGNVTTKESRGETWVKVIAWSETEEDEEELDESLKSKVIVSL